MTYVPRGMRKDITTSSESDSKWRREVSDMQIESFKEKMRNDLKKDKEYNMIDSQIRKILSKIDGDPIISRKCAMWKGEAKGNITVGETKVQIRRTMYHWLVEDIMSLRNYNIGNLPTCEIGICCNVSHLIKVIKPLKDDLQYAEKKIDLRTTTNSINRKRESVKRALDEFKVRQVVEGLKSGQPVRKVSSALDVPYVQVNRISKGRTWSQFSNISPLKKRQLEENKARNKKMEEYVRKHCGYVLRSSLLGEEIPTIKELHSFLTKLIGNFNRLGYYRLGDVPDEKDCIFAHKNFHYRGRQISSARICYRWFIGDIPSGSLVIRMCRSKHHCIRPEHLQTVRREDNVTEPFYEEPIDGDISFSSSSSSPDYSTAECSESAGKKKRRYDSNVSIETAANILKLEPAKIIRVVPTDVRKLFF